MQHLFSPAGEQALIDVMQRRPLLAFDFDGTLAPIVARPDDARVAPEVADRLQRLTQRAPLAIVTGRSRADVAPRLGFQPHFLIGSHGAEDPQGPPLPPESDAALQALREQIARERTGLASAGVEVEDKQQSLALHYRQATDQSLALARIEALLDGLGPALHRFGGKCVVNVVAASAPDKGQAVRTLLARAGASAAVFVGDDLNDEAVFAAAEAHWLTVRIGRDDPSTRAMFCLDRHEQVVELLDRLLDRLPDVSAEGVATAAAAPTAR